MSAIPASANIPALSSLLKQLQDLGPDTKLAAEPRTGAHDTYTFRNRQVQRDPHDDPDQHSEEDTDEDVTNHPAQWRHIEDLVRALLTVPEVQEYPDTKSMLEKCIQQLMKLRRYGGADYQGQTLQQIESAYNQLVDHIRPFYTLDDTVEGMPLSTIERAMLQIVTETVRIGRALSFIKFLQLESEPNFGAQLICELKVLEEGARARGDQQAATFSQNVHARFTQFTDLMRSNSKSAARNKYNSMVAHIKAYLTPENIARTSRGDRRRLNAVVICLLCYGGRAGLKLNDLQAMDVSYWQYAHHSIHIQ